MEARLRGRCRKDTKHPLRMVSRPALTDCLCLQAIWDLLTGVVSPSGRLPQQWPISVGGVRVGGVGDYMIK